jgi:hypothetical protein
MPQRFAKISLVNTEPRFSVDMAKIFRSSSVTAQIESLGLWYRPFPFKSIGDTLTVAISRVAKSTSSDNSIGSCNDANRDSTDIERSSLIGFQERRGLVTSSASVERLGVGFRQGLVTADADRAATSRLANASE